MMQFADRYGSDGVFEAALVESRWRSGLVCPPSGGKAHSSRSQLSRRHFRCTAFRRQRNVTIDTISELNRLGLLRSLLTVHLLTQSRRIGVSLEVPPQVLPQDRLAAQVPTHGGDAHPRGAPLRLLGACRGRRPRSWRRAFRCQGQVRLGEYGGVRGGSAEGRTRFVSLRRPAHTFEEFAVFAALSIAPSIAFVSDGQGWLVGGKPIGAEHERVVTGRSKVSTEMSQCLVVKTCLGLLKR